MAGRVSPVILLMSVVTYLHMLDITEDMVIEQLEEFSAERVAQENHIFRLAEWRHHMIRDEFVRTYGQIDPEVAEAWFNESFEIWDDGTRRMPREYFHGTVLSNGRTIEGMSVVIGNQTPITGELMRRMAVLFDIVSRFGPAWRPDFQNLYVFSPDYTSTCYWPEVAWALEVPADFLWEDQEWVQGPTIERNPERSLTYTGLFYDEPSGHWMVSAVLPIDVDGEYLTAVSTDLLLTELVRRTINENLAGTHNLILGNDGRMVVSPDLLRSIETDSDIDGSFTEEYSQRLLDLTSGIRTFPAVVDNWAG